MNGYDLKELLKYIKPYSLSYQEWINVGMALKQEGYSASDWDQWSMNDDRYKAGECFRKWDTFSGDTAEPVTGGTIVEYAKRGGFVPSGNSDDLGTALDWDSVIQKEEGVVVDKGWLEEKEVEEPSDAVWQPVQELITYLETLFQSTENVGYVTEVYQNDDRLSPKKGCWDRTAGELIEQLKKCGGDIGKVIGDCNPQAGAWIRFNPLDGKGIKNENVTDFRYALVESDSTEIGKQNAIIRELELPVAALVFSGKKSVHAIVRIEAGDYAEYKKRVDYLYKICHKNGLEIDVQNKNPSRLSRMPGVIRNGHKQFLMATNIGKKSWTEWQEWIEAVNDDLPDPEDLAAVWDNIPPLADCLIDGVLRKGHKMLLAGPSKAGKSFALIELCIAIAEGRQWLGFQCAQGRVLYVNLELDRASCLHRFKDVYDALGWQPKNIRNIDIWNLRGKAVPMDRLAPKLIRRAEKRNYTAVIIDPIYKVITGDENSADQMANFCNQFDKICTELKAATIYCHHHSKGNQGGKKAMDRASGSGVFARDPDALLDLTELELTDGIRRLQAGKARIRGIERALNEFAPGWTEEVGQDDRLSPSQMQEYAERKLLLTVQHEVMLRYIEEEQKRVQGLTAWRIDGILREFPKLETKNVWFQYPIHVDDDTGMLADIKLDDGSWESIRKKRKDGRKQQAQEAAEQLQSDFEVEFANIEFEGREVPAQELAEAIGCTSKTLLGWLGKGNKVKKNIDINFEKYMGEDGRMYIRRKVCDGATN